MRLSVERKIDCQINGKMSESVAGNKSCSMDPISITTLSVTWSHWLCAFIPWKNNSPSGIRGPIDRFSASLVGLEPSLSWANLLLKTQISIKRRWRLMVIGLCHLSNQITKFTCSRPLIISLTQIAWYHAWTKAWTRNVSAPHFRTHSPRLG